MKINKPHLQKLSFSVRMTSTVALDLSLTLACLEGKLPPRDYRPPKSSFESIASVELLARTELDFGPLNVSTREQFYDSIIEQCVKPPFVSCAFLAGSPFLIKTKRAKPGRGRPRKDRFLAEPLNLFLKAGPEGLQTICKLNEPKVWQFEHDFARTWEANGLHVAPSAHTTVADDSAKYFFSFFLT